jgi:ribosomal protein S18 acetylase RimI-like enzyme
VSDLSAVASEKVTADGLVLRQVSADDGDRLADLLALAHADLDGVPNAAVRRWVADLFDHGHPTIELDDMQVAEDQRTGALVSHLMGTPQTWSYAGIPIGVSLMELAATHPDYRGRGLVNGLLERLVARSSRRGDLVQGMTDILFFPSQSGFLPTLTQRAGRGGSVRHLPPVPASGEPVTIRSAEVDDLATLVEMEHQASRQVLLSCPREAREWRHELDGRSHDSMVRDEVMLIEESGRPVGFLVLGYGGIPSFPIPHWLPGEVCPEPVVSIARYELLPGVSWFDVTPSVLRQVTAAGGDDDQGAEGYMLWLDLEHPAYDALGHGLPRRPPQMGWFLRVPDLAALISQVAPVLERRLRGTVADGFSGDLRLHFYRHGIHLEFRNGTLAAVEPWTEHSRRASDASLPDQMFQQLLFGHGTWEELAPASPDCRLQTTTAQALLPLLFPKQTSSIWPLV